MSNTSGKFILGLVMMVSVNQIFTQTYTITPDDTLIAEAIPDQLTIFDIFMDNSAGSDTLIVYWERISLDIPDEWDYSLCDLGTCYPGVPDGGVMYPVEPGQQGFLGFNVFPLTVSGSTTLVMRVWEESSPDVIDTLVWIVSSDFGIAVTSQFENSISIFPTIADQNITINNITEENSLILIFDLNGNIVCNELLHAGTNAVEVGGLSAGYYMATIYSNGAAIKSQSIIIQ